MATFVYIVRHAGGGEFVSEWSSESSAANAAQAEATRLGKSMQYAKVGTDGSSSNVTIVSPMYRASCPSCTFTTNEYGSQSAADDALAKHRSHKKH